MSDRNTKRLVNWLIRMAGDGDGRVSLGHLSASGQGVPLGQWAIRHSDADPALAQLADSILDAAASDTDGQPSGTPQQYVVLAYHEDAPDKPVSRLPFRLAASEQFAPEGSALTTEPPTERGLVAQTLRHNELLLRTSFGALGSAASQLERHNLMLGEQVTRLTAQVFQMQEERQRLLDRETERLLEIEQFEADRDQRARVTNAVLSAGQGFVATLASGGKPLALPASTPGEATAAATPVPAGAVSALGQIRDLLDSMSPEQTQQLMGVLTPTQQASFFMLHQLFVSLEPAASDDEPAAAEEG